MKKILKKNSINLMINLNLKFKTKKFKIVINKTLQSPL